MLNLDASVKTPLYRQIYEQIKQEILSGVLPGGTRLVSTRTLAKDLQAGRNTVENAYAQLVLEGYVIAQPGSGYVVRSLQHDLSPDALEQPDDETARSAPRKNKPPRCAYNFDYGALGAWAFPYKAWRHLTSTVLVEAEDMHARNPAMQSRDEMQGDKELRRELVKHLYHRRGVNCTVDQVVVCNGLQPGLFSLLRIFPFQERIVAMENPGYRRARVVLQGSGFEICPIPVLEDGADIAALAASPALMAFVTPSRQYPTGRVMPIQKRMDILQWAAERGGLIIEDDYDSEYRYKGKPIPSLQSIDRQGRVVYIGSFSKTLSPGLRLGYMVLPEWLLDPYRDAFAGYKCSVSWLEQKILARFMAEGHMEKHIRKMCLLNKKKHDTLIEAVTASFGDKVRIHGQNAGLHLLLEFPGGETETELVEKAAEYGVKVYPGSALWMEGTQPPATTILMGYGTLPDDKIPEAVSLLREAWFGKKRKNAQAVLDGTSSVQQTDAALPDRRR